jgi:GTP1/Obg family GTP-binding protein
MENTDLNELRHGIAAVSMPMQAHQIVQQLITNYEQKLKVAADTKEADGIKQMIDAKR